MSRLMAFVDGENLTARYEEMVKDGRNARAVDDDRNMWGNHYAVVHEPRRFVWSRGTVRQLFDDDSILRVHYYAMAEGDAAMADEIGQQLAAQQAQYLTPARNQIVRLIPRVFHKIKRNTKTKSVDINICVEVMEYVNRNALDSVYLVTGDIDYSPLVEAVMRAGKRVYIAALSGGLAPRLRTGTDRFVDLDSVYFA